MCTHKWSISLAQKEMQLIMQTRYHYTPTRMKRLASKVGEGELEFLGTEGEQNR